MEPLLNEQPAETSTYDTDETLYETEEEELYEEEFEESDYTDTDSTYYWSNKMDSLRYFDNPGVADFLQYIAILLHPPKIYDRWVFV